MWDQRMDRRTAIKQALRLAALPPVVLALQACGKSGASAGGSTGLSCSDTSGLSARQKRQREVSGYVDRSPHPQKLCSNCGSFKSAAQAGACAKCSVVPGPINPDGYCIFWTEKA